MLLYLSTSLFFCTREMGRLTHTNMRGLDREHALMLTGVLPTVMLNHLQSHDDIYRYPSRECAL